MQQQTGSQAVAEGTLLWEPTAKHLQESNIARYMGWLERNKGLHFNSYDELWQWSVTEVEDFWVTIWDYFEVKAHKPYTKVLAERKVEGAQWFPGAELNYAEHMLHRRDDHLAVLFASEGHPTESLTYAQLWEQTAQAAAGLHKLGVERGDRVVAYMPNIPETLVAFLAVASIGATWSSCPPEFGIPSVVDRFTQLEPKVLLTVGGYEYGGKQFDAVPRSAELQDKLPTLKATVVVPYRNAQPALESLKNPTLWDDFLVTGQELAFEPVTFDHPLWVLYSSGTTGAPKAIVQGHGGILLEHLKVESLHLDLTADDRFFWFSTTGWMMWNFLISGLLLGSTVVLYDGSPGYPDMLALWRMAEETKTTFFGISAPYTQACMKADIHPNQELDLSRIRGLGSTGAPLPPEGFAWVYDNVNRELLLGSASGGTDACTAFIGPCPLLPVRAGELQCRTLGSKVEAFDEAGNPVIDDVGELVITEPLPSMPIYFLNDPGGQRLHESYFDLFPGIWRHGDWMKITPNGGCIIYGRSDSTLNRNGVRMGTSDFYRVVDELPEVMDSMVVETSHLGSEGKLYLFVVLRENTSLDDELTGRINKSLWSSLSPRHVPDEIHAIPAVPKTLSGKKLEVPVRRMFLGAEMEKVVSLDALANPESMKFFQELVKTS